MPLVIPNTNPRCIDPLNSTVLPENTLEISKFPYTTHRKVKQRPLQPVPAALTHTAWSPIFHSLALSKHIRLYQMSLGVEPAFD